MWIANVVERVVILFDRCKNYKLKISKEAFAAVLKFCVFFSELCGHLSLKIRLVAIFLLDFAGFWPYHLILITKIYFKPLLSVKIVEMHFSALSLGPCSLHSDHEPVFCFRFFKTLCRFKLPPSLSFFRLNLKKSRTL